MDDGLAEKLFNAFWAPIVAAGYPPPAKWDELGDAPRIAWQAAAAEARRIHASQVEARVEMLEGAIEGWRREAAATEERIEQHVEGVRVATREAMANFADVLTEAIKSNPGECRAMLTELRDNLSRISLVS